jgi:Protein of unknown function (DUF2281)
MGTDKAILKKIHALPEKAKEQILVYIEYLNTLYQSGEESKDSKFRKFGSSQGKYTLSSDFDEPLEDFKPYMG